MEKMLYLPVEKKRGSIMNINLQTGLLNEAFFHPSPYCNLRPGGPSDIDLLIVHGISLPPGQFGTGDVIKFFCGQLEVDKHPYFETIQHLKVTAHLLIERDGTLLQFVPFHQRAWHAGVSEFAGRSGCNDFSIGVELEGTDDTPYTPVQYQRLAEVVAALQIAYPAITRSRIVGHCDVAPGRKTDPGPHFDWASLDCLLTTDSA
jgi:AmpD protein